MIIKIAYTTTKVAITPLWWVLSHGGRRRRRIKSILRNVVRERAFWCGGLRDD